jgi:putative methyltransferase (TIGR04325 family)
MCFAYVLARAAHQRDRISMLDWGGGLGQYGLLARALVPEVEVEYHCHELALMADAGRELIPDATFHSDPTETFSRSYDLVMASGALHYVEDWRALLVQLAASTVRWLFITRQPFVEQASTFVVIQHPLNYGYDTEYPGWVLNRVEFLDAAAEAGLTLRRELLTGENPNMPSAPEQPEYKGMLFERGS